MTIEEAIAIIENEKKCVNRANKNDYCNRDCYNCELVKTDTEILTALDLAIKALEQQPCEDAISKQAMFEILTKYNLEMSKIAEDMNKLPPAVPQQKYGKWIPFSERLPKPFEHCLITTIDGEVIYHYDDGQYSKYKAWMPLPKPYESQESEEQTE